MKTTNVLEELQFILFLMIQVTRTLNENKCINRGKQRYGIDFWQIPTARSDQRGLLLIA